MKKILIIVMLIILSVISYSKNKSYDYSRDKIPIVKNEKIYFESIINSD